MCVCVSVRAVECTCSPNDHGGAHSHQIGARLRADHSGTPLQTTAPSSSCRRACVAYASALRALAFDGPTYDARVSRAYACTEVHLPIWAIARGCRIPICSEAAPSPNERVSTLRRYLKYLVPLTVVVVLVFFLLPSCGFVRPDRYGWSSIRKMGFLRRRSECIVK